MRSTLDSSASHCSEPGGLRVWLKAQHEAFASYGPRTLLIGIALVQAWRVYSSHLTQWKGGGFGMFSTVDTGSTRPLQCHLIIDHCAVAVTPPPQVAASLQTARSFPHTRNLERLAGRIASMPWRRLDPAVHNNTCGHDHSPTNCALSRTAQAIGSPAARDELDLESPFLGSLDFAYPPPVIALWVPFDPVTDDPSCIEHFDEVEITIDRIAYSIADGLLTRTPLAQCRVPARRSPLIVGTAGLSKQYLQGRRSRLH